MDKREYVQGIVRALNGMAVRMADVAPPFDPDTIPPERAEAVRNWRGGLVEEVRTRAITEINGLDAPEELAGFHESLVKCITEPDTEPTGQPSWHAAPAEEGWPRVMMRLALLCQEESIPFPTSKPVSEPPEPEPERAAGDDWRSRVRRELELRGHPDPDEAIERLETLGSNES